MPDEDRPPEVAEVVPGEYEVRLGERQHRVLVPAGVGVPGVDDDELAATVVVILAERGVEVPDVVDVSAALREHARLLDEVAERTDDQD